MNKTNLNKIKEIQMSEEILAKESEEMTEEELSEKRKAAAEQDSSDGEEE